MKRLLTVAASVLLIHFVSAQARAQDDPAAAYREAADSIDADLAAELAKLSALRKEIAAEKPAVSRATGAVAAELREKRHRVEVARQKSDGLQHELKTIDERLRLWRDESIYIDSLLADFRKQYEAEASVAAFQQLTAAAPDTILPLDLALQAMDELAEVQRQGGRVIAGRALDDGGVAIDGTFIEVGPLSWFFSDKEKLAGLVIEGRDLRPEVVAGTGSADELGKFAAGGVATLSIDPTLGAALAQTEAETGWVERTLQGGLWIYPILFLALMAIAAALMKWRQIAGIRDVSPMVVRRVIDAVNAGDVAGAESAVDELSHPAAKLLRRGIAVADQSRELVEESLYEEYIAAQLPLQRGLPVIAIASGTAPLLGLLGTVTGMIATFQQIRIFGTSDTNVIAGGVSEALITTECGLAVAIPAVIVHALLSRRVQGIRSAMEMTSLAFVNGLEQPQGEGGEKA